MQAHEKRIRGDRILRFGAMGDCDVFVFLFFGNIIWEMRWKMADMASRGRVLCECKRCKGGHQWLTSGKPKVCPKCHSPYWSVERKKKSQKND